MSATASISTPLSWPKALSLAVLGAVAFHLAYLLPALGSLVTVYLFCVAALARLNTSRKAFYLGLATGLAVYAPQLSFFFDLFGWKAIALWLVLAFWLSVFLLLARQALVTFGPRWGWACLPFLWTGLEYFRSELYFLRFTWLNAGYAFSDSLSWLPVKWLGVYGLGFVLMLAVACLNLLPRKPAVLTGLAVLVTLGLLTNLPPGQPEPPATGLHVAGAQMEFPPEKQVTFVLDRLIKKHPEAELLVLSEYTFTGPPPPSVREWCRKNQRHLIVGGHDPVPGANQYFNTAFVIDPRGETVFQQAKSVPIQFFADGLPAREQKLWNSPWGQIGICICYDLSYTRVTDRLIRQGARALIVPTMDVAAWGEHEHKLHGRIAPMRAAEYGVPVFRVASSGISQLVGGDGRILATAPFNQEEAMITGTLSLQNIGRRPFDRWLAPGCVVLTALLILWLALGSLVQKLSKRW